MNGQDLRKEVSRLMAEAGGLNHQQLIDAIMAQVKNHVVYIIGDDQREEMRVPTGDGDFEIQEGGRMRQFLKRLWRRMYGWQQ